MSNSSEEQLNKTIPENMRRMSKILRGTRTTGIAQIRDRILAEEKNTDSLETIKNSSKNSGNHKNTSTEDENNNNDWFVPKGKILKL